MTYGKPELQVIGSAKTLVRGGANGRKYPDNPVGCGGNLLSRDTPEC
jgi:hypothetical protein